MTTNLKLPARKGWFDPCGEWIGSGYDAEWNAALDEVARMNSVQPSPAQVECIDCHGSGFCMSISNEEIRCPCRAPIKFSGLAQAEQAEAERPEVVGSAWRNIYNNGFDHVAPFPPAPGGPVVDEPLMTVAQHERIVEARWNRAMDLMGEHVARISEKFKAERDAALARVAELEKREPAGVPMPDEIHQMAFEEGQPADDGDGYLFSSEEFDLFVQRLLDSCAAPPAKAQHSVPEGWKLVPEDATLEMVEALKTELVTTSKGGILRAGIALNAAIAAAPGKEGL
ncbi:hypothetical protein ACP0H8_12185 [Pseudomonas aeruginosa]